MPNLLTIRQAAAKINVCRNTMRAMMDDGRALAVNIAKPGAKKPTWRIVAASLEAFRVEPLGQAVLEERLREAELDRRCGW
jgi:hypothetical protein